MDSFNDLSKWFNHAQRIVIVGVGNPIRRDDNIGVEIINELEGKISKSVLLIKSETIPENFFKQIIEFRPTHILVIDAALLNLKSGLTKFVRSMELSNVAISTHSLPIQIFCEFLTKMTNAKIAMLLIQPEDIRFGEGLSSELELTKKKLVNYLVRTVKSVAD